MHTYIVTFNKPSHPACVTIDHYVSAANAKQAIRETKVDYHGAVANARARRFRV